jgi:hypothetical protein
MRLRREKAERAENGQGSDKENAASADILGEQDDQDVIF